MDISNPQFRESIITMDGEIVRPRVRTLAQAAALTPRANILAFKDDSVDEYYFPRALREQGGSLLIPITYEIGVWNMDTTEQATVACAVTPADVRLIMGIIFNDAGQPYPLPVSHTVNYDYFDAMINRLQAGNIYLRRRTGGTCDSPAWDDGAMNRGFITVFYVP